MNISATISSFKKWLAVFIAAAVFCAPVFADVETYIPTADNCDIEAVSDFTLTNSDTDDVPDHKGHGQHSHTCSSCHVHMIREDLSAAGLTISFRANPKPNMTGLAPRASPLGLFRPPRG